MPRGQHNKREKPDKQTQGDSPPKQKPRAHSLEGDAEKKERTESLAQTLEFDYRVGNDNKQFSLLYVPEVENTRTFLFISNHAFARSVKKDSSVTLKAFDDKAVTINSVIDLTKVSPASAGFYGGAGDAKPSIVGMLAAAYEINQAVLQSRKEVGATGVLVHCESGLERSVSSTLFYLTGYHEYSFEEAAQLLFDALNSGRSEERAKKHNPAHGNNHHQTVQSLFEGVETVNRGEKVRCAIESANSLVTRERILENSISVTTVLSPKRTQDLNTLISKLKPVVSTSSSGLRRSTRSRRTSMLTVAASADRGQDYKKQEVEKTNEAEEAMKTTASSSSSESDSVKPPDAKVAAHATSFSEQASSEAPKCSP